jgi:Na+/proline symporter
VIRPHGDASDLPWYSVLLGYPVLGLWYWCADQTIVQRVLGAKDENHARVGPLFAGFIKILPVFIFVLPGTICLALIHQGKLPPLPLVDGKPDTNATLADLITGLLPVGLKGVMAASLLAALMSTVSGALNSIATLFSYDLFKRWRPETSDRTLVRVGRAVTFCAMIAAILWSPYVGQFGSIFKGINTLIGYVAPPVTALFIWGVFFRRISPTGAIITAWFGTLLGFVVFAVDWSKSPRTWLEFAGVDIPFLMVAVYLFIACSIVLALTSVSLALAKKVAWAGTAFGVVAALAVWRGAMGWLPNVNGVYDAWVGWILIPSFLVAVGSPVLLVVSYLTPPQPTPEEGETLVWRTPLDALRGDAWHGLGDFRVLAGILFAIMVMLYWVFS